MAILGYTLAVLIGLSLGLVGSGGSVLAVPVLVYVMGVDTKQAVPMSLAVVGAVSLVGMITHWQEGNIVWSKVITLGGPAMVGAFIGAKIGAILDPLVQMTLFGVAMIVAAYFMIKRSSDTFTLNFPVRLRGVATHYCSRKQRLHPAHHWTRRRYPAKL
jgi:uncharacterized membrane protein YfcA